MTDVFGKEEKAAARREKKFLFWTWFALLVAVAAVVATLVTLSVYMVEVQRNRGFTFLFGAISAIITIAFACYSLFFFSIKYRLTRKYVAMLKDMERGLKDTFEGKFLGYDNSVGMKDGVYFYSMLLKTRPLRRGDIDERKLLIEYTVPKIELEEGTKLKLVSHANILMAYEILEIPALKNKECEAKTETNETAVSNNAITVQENQLTNIEDEKQ
ncbi:hypothetical protein [Pumilibacter muris]|jgi:hypothetical protein|uniref:hypothetical protein n=1 Tax=Pumilibacter muris TaxID=2941510 RepID=UPI002042080A|nr:hypothetical protein [Pumilibacter muris]